MKTQPLKLIGLTVAALALTTGSALAGNGKDCNHKKEAKVKSETTATSMMKTDVLSTSATMTPQTKMHKVYSVEDAKQLCAKKGAKDMAACVGYKTGKMKKTARAPKT